ncbi:MAG: response regulator [Candidatus Omnitrophica bacterium]|nr:response regulator [Candidatus Omnitrophota bacterium]
MIKLLLVDDEKGLCDILKDFFKIYGLQALIATNGKEAVALVKKQKPQIVILDIQMPDMSGLEVLKEIKQIDSSIKVIMITVMDDEQTKNAARQLGADEFITKPIISDHLEEVVRQKITELIGEDKTHA